MNDALFSAINDIERVAKKQRTCSEKTMKYLTQMVRTKKERREESANSVPSQPLVPSSFSH